MKEKKGWFEKLAGKFLGSNKRFHEVHINHEVLEDIMNIARESHPHEFVALLEGKIKDEVLTIDGLVFLPAEASNEGAVMQIFMRPLLTTTVGSVHSHPTPNASPSPADLHFFAKNGLFHIIIGFPYEEYSIGAYNGFGEPADYQVV